MQELEKRGNYTLCILALAAFSIPPAFAAGECVANQLKLNKAPIERKAEQVDAPKLIDTPRTPTPSGITILKQSR